MPEANDTAFDQARFEAIYPSGVERHYWNRCRNRVIARELRTRGALGPMLEVGCGKGLVVAYLLSEGFDITGVELADVEPVAAARDHVVVATDAMDLPEARSSTIRTILLLDVIEHLEEPRTFIAALRRKFPAATHFVYTVPARQELFSNYDRFNEHFRRYDPGLLRAHVDAGDLRRTHMSYFFHALYPAALLQLRIAGERALRFRVPREGFATWVHRVLGGLFVLEHRLLPARWRGTSMIAVVQDRPKAQ